MSSSEFKTVELEAPELEYDGELCFSVGKSRFETSWKNKKASWSKLLKRLSNSIPTHETHSEYMRMSKADQDRIKDIGGFVGGHLKEGHRRNGYVLSRQIITLDVDFAPANLWDELMDNLDLDCAMAVYSTHKHTEKKPRLRIVMPLDREVTPDEYEAISRKIAEKIDIEYFDDTTFQPTRLMYWPSNSKDTEPFFKYYDSEFLKADEVLAEYPDWTDASFWPISSRVDAIIRKGVEKAGDPLEKPGIIGAFNRAYDIPAAIDAFLSDVYTPTSKDNRYTYAQGSTAAGVVLYNDGLFMYSNHSTDPCSMKLCNAFDMVRIHKFGHLDSDEDIASNKVVTRLNSYKEMKRFAENDDQVKISLSEQRTKEAIADFAPLEENEDWKTRLSYKGDAIESTLRNCLLILTFDERLAGIRRNEMSRTIEAPLTLPWERHNIYWTDLDADILYSWIAEEYKVQFPSEQFYRAINTVSANRSYHPVRDFLDELPEWDGKERLDTLLIDYFSSEDSLYTREAIRKSLVGAVARIYEPGCKFDYMLVLNGPQGVGKSTFFSKIAGEWFSDSLSMIDMKDKTGAELLQGYWIIEVGEMAGMRKADIEVVKSFISRQNDIYRRAYGRNTEHHPRQCIIVGSTNAETGFLRDITGNRRFWPIRLRGKGKKNPWNMTEEDIKQIWAEAKKYYKDGEELILSEEAEKIAQLAQKDAMEEDPRQHMVEDYLERLLPENWYRLDIDERKAYINGEYPEVEEEAAMVRTYISNAEIWVECLGKRREDMQSKDSYALAAIMTKIPGWEKSSSRKKINGYGLSRIYRRTETPENILDF